MTEAQKTAIVDAIQTLAEFGSDAAVVVRAALNAGTIEPWQLNEAIAQLEDV